MKTKTNMKPASRLTSDSQSRLVAYTAAAGLGAFFGGQTVEGQVTESHAPFTLFLDGYAYQYLDIDGDGTNDFKLLRDYYAMFIYGTRPGNLIISSSSGSIALTNGVTLDATTGRSFSYLLLAGQGYYGYNPDFIDNARLGASPSSKELGFSFTGGDGKTHFGYMHVQGHYIVNGHANYGPEWLEMTINGIYYNKTPNAAIVTGSLPPVIVSATSIQVGAKNAVTINFTSSDNAAASAFTLETSAVPGASASWTADTKAVISSSGPGIYKAVTTGKGGPSQFFRIKH